MPHSIARPASGLDVSPIGKSGLDSPELHLVVVELVPWKQWLLWI
jgi:hypothetical protein